MSIYQKILGPQYKQLHPMLQKRYNLTKDNQFKASGVMQTITGGPKWLYPLFRLGSHWKLVFPEHGKQIPFTILNTYQIGTNGEEHVHWERIFFFGEKKRYFNALMSYDPERKIIKDYLGQPRLLYSDLVFHVSPEGNLSILSKKQRLVLGPLEIPLPRILQGVATVHENYLEDRDSFQIKVEVQNPLIGRIFAYEGEFTEDVQA